VIVENALRLPARRLKRLIQINLEYRL